VGVSQRVIKAHLPADELQQIPWHLYEKGDPGFLLDLYERITYRTGELGEAFAEGPGRLATAGSFRSRISPTNARHWKRGARVITDPKRMRRSAC
jgi:aldehyde:ferredoxin oxidoreductase